MYRLAVVLSLLAAVMAGPISSELNEDWQAFKATYRKLYQPQEETLRRIIWEDNIRYIQKHNIEADRGVHTYWLGENHYADMTHEEFVKVMNGFKMNISSSNACGHFMAPSHVQLSDLPDEVDWRKEGYVTPVKNQEQCGSCWAFSTTGSLEGQHFKKTGQLVSLSEQNLVDCSQKEGNHGCGGGLMDNAFQYIIVNHGIDTEDSYQYTARDGKCKFKSQSVGATEVSCMDIQSQSVSDLQKAVATVGPISVAMDASHRSFQLYKTGIYSEPACSPTQLDHGVLAVGYGSQGGQDYWLIKNSWGTVWGMQGYFMLLRDSRNMCGVATMASFPTV
ncbi:hypothetical protein ACJMK2_026435 [Sinanodonta woodiana]|uniref:Cathepsin L n=1 Tax=Sinanodonta woodiana TaxID=1069815 RepID=A0ABD3XN25_SINWO